MEANMDILPELLTYLKKDNNNGNNI